VRKNRHCSLDNRLTAASVDRLAHQTSGDHHRGEEVSDADKVSKVPRDARSAHQRREGWPNEDRHSHGLVLLVSRAKAVATKRKNDLRPTEWQRIGGASVESSDSKSPPHWPRVLLTSESLLPIPTCKVKLARVARRTAPFDTDGPTSRAAYSHSSRSGHEAIRVVLWVQGAVRPTGFARSREGRLRYRNGGKCASTDRRVSGRAHTQRSMPSWRHIY
jgi:hypothetical protein